MKKLISFIISLIVIVAVVASVSIIPSFSAENEKYVVHNGFSEYKIVIPEKATDNETFAAQELQFFIKDANGTELEIISDNGITFNQNDKYLSIGNTEIYKNSGLDLSNEDLNTDGYIVKTLGSTVIMAGNGVNSPLYATYGFLENQFDYEYFAKDEWTINKENTVKLKSLDIKERPTFQGRQLDSRVLYNDNLYAVRMRLTGGQGVRYNSITSTWATLNDTSLMSQLIRYDDYKDKKTEDGYLWVTGSGTTGQLCITSATYDQEYFDTISNKLIEEYVIKQPNAQIFMLGINDNPYYCKCDRCTNDMNLYGHSGMMVRFVNKVADRVQSWIDENQPGREVYLCMFAYIFDFMPPVRYDNNLMKYIPNDPSCICRPNVMVRIAPIDSVNMYPHMDEEKNGSAAVAFNGWKACTNNFSIWDYGTNFKAYLAPYPDWNTVKINLQLYKELGAKDVLTQLPNHTEGTSMNELMIYIRSQLMWDLEQSYDDLLNKFMTNYYKEAASSMIEYYHYLQTKFQMFAEQNKCNGDIYDTAININLFSYNELLQIERIFNKAFNQIVQIEQLDINKYNVLSKRLKTESLFYRYLLINSCSVYYTVDDILQMIDSFYQDAAVANLTQFSNAKEGADLTSVVEKWKNKALSN